MDGSPPKHKPAIVIWEGLPDISGGQRVALNIAALLEEGFDISFIIPSSGQLSSALGDMGIQSVYAPTGSYQRGQKGILDILRFLSRTPAVLFISSRTIKDADLIYANSTKVFIWSAIMGSIMNVPVIWHLHNLLVDNTSKLLLKMFSRFNSVRKIIAVSRAAANHHDLPGDKVEVVYNGVDLSAFRMRHTNRNSSVKKIAIIADLLPQKGHSTLIRAVKRMKDQTPVELSIVGASLDSAAYENELRKLVDQLGLQEYVTFLGYRSDIPEVLDSLDALVVPSSSYEACPMAALEAFAAGVPVIGSDLGGTPELIDEGRTGYVFRAGNDKDLADKISLLFSNHKLLTEMGANCRKKAEDQYDLKKSVRTIEMIIDSVLQDRDSHAP